MNVRGMGAAGGAQKALTSQTSSAVSVKHELSVRSVISVLTLRRSKLPYGQNWNNKLHISAQIVDFQRFINRILSETARLFHLFT